MNPKNKGWEKEFDEKFTRVNAQNGNYEDNWFIKDVVKAIDVKSFIATQIHLAEERTARSGKKMYQIGYKDGVKKQCEETLDYTDKEVSKARQKAVKEFAMIVTYPNIQALLERWKG